MNTKLNEAIKLVLEMLRADPDKENKYHLACAHNELMKVFVKGEKK